MTYQSALRRAMGSGFPPVVTLCGSTRFVERFNYHRQRLTLDGWVVLSIEIVTTQSAEDDPQHVDTRVKERLDRLHLRKIDISDYVYVINVGGYIGLSTQREIAYATHLGVTIMYDTDYGRPT